MVDQVVLMVVLGGVEAFQRLDFRRDRAAEDFRGVQLRDVRLGDALLLG